MHCSQSASTASRRPTKRSPKSQGITSNNCGRFSRPAPTISPGIPWAAPSPSKWRRLLEANGETVATLILMDSPTRGRSRWYRMIQRVINSITNNYSGRLTLSASRVAKPLSAGVMAVAEGLADDSR